MIEKTEKGISYMTSDAKIGLLLGFVFILVIISLVNGLPGLIGKDSQDGVFDASSLKALLVQLLDCDWMNWSIIPRINVS